MIYSDYLAEWLAIYKKPFLSNSSYQRLLFVVKQVPKSLLDCPLSKLTVLDLDRSVSRCSSSRSAKYLLHLYKNSLQKAYVLGLLDKDLSSKLSPVRYNAITGKSLTYSEQDSLLASIAGSEYQDIFEFLLYSGCRRSEALALSWSDVDFKQKRIHIRGTKTVNSDRVLFLFPALESLLLRVLKGACLQAPTEAPAGRLFNFRADTLSHAFKRYCPNHKLHDLRHTFITRCAQSGIDMKVVSKFVGHSDILVTYRIYTTVFTDFESSEISRLKFDKK